MREDRLFEIEYGYWFNLANERFYRHVDVVLNMIQLVGGSAAALGAIQNQPGAVIAAGLALAVCAAVGLLVNPAVKTEQHRACKAQWRTLSGRAAQLSDDALVAEVVSIQASGPNGIGALAHPACNATVRASGQGAYAQKLTPMQWVAQAIA